MSEAPVSIEVEVARISKQLEEFVVNLQPVPSIESLAVLFILWAVRAAIAGDASKEDFQNGVDRAWQSAIEEFAQITPVQLRQGGKPS